MPAYPTLIRANFADGKWHTVDEIACYLKEPNTKVVYKALHRMTRLTNQGLVEQRKVGLVDEFRIFNSRKMVNSQDLTNTLQPIIRRLKEQGRQSPAKVSPPAIMILANELEKALIRWTQVPPDARERASGGALSERSGDDCDVAETVKEAAGSSSVDLTATVHSYGTRGEGSDT